MPKLPMAILIDPLAAPNDILNGLGSLDDAICSSGYIESIGCDGATGGLTLR